MTAPSKAEGGPWPARLQALHAAMLRVHCELAVRRQLRRDRRRARRGSTHLPFPGVGRLHRFVAGPPLASARPGATRIGALANHHVEGRFDLLGSGWVSLRHGESRRGLEGRRYEPGPAVVADPDGAWLEGRVNAENLEASRAIWRLVDREHVPIDWQVDFVSGYRWSERDWFGDLPTFEGHPPGADVKVPWELGRMQHLPLLAYAFALASEGTGGEAGLHAPEVYARALRNQVLDFIATNPPQFGVQWLCPMDVAIRAANWLLAWDLLVASGAERDERLERAIVDSVYAHGAHVYDHLEWRPRKRNNHYLANLAGLIFIAAYLPESERTNGWLAFAVEQLIVETARQFGVDGATAEGASGYHRLSAEMVAHATALVVGLPEDRTRALARDARRPRFGRPGGGRLVLAPLPGGGRPSPLPERHFETLVAAAEFCLDLTKPSGEIPQFGDADAGRFFKLDPTHTCAATAEVRRCFRNLEGYEGLAADEDYWLEDPLDHRTLLATVAGLVDRPALERGAAAYRLERDVVRALAGGAPIPSRSAPRAHAGRADDAAWQRWRAPANAAADRSRTCEIPAPGSDLRAGLRLRAYVDFGVYLFRSDRLYLAVRCGRVGFGGTGSHNHNDQLSFELAIDGVDLVVDPGTYVYSPLPDRRNLYRSAAAHVGPRLVGHEPEDLGLGLFQSSDRCAPECLYFGESGFVGRYRGPGATVHRRIAVRPAALEIVDWVECDDPELGPTLAPSFLESGVGLPVSPGYGWLARDRHGLSGLRSWLRSVRSPSHRSAR